MAMNNNLLQSLNTCTRFCTILQNAADFEKDEFINAVLSLLPRIYVDFLEYQPLEEDCYDEWARSYVDEMMYDSIRKNIGALMGEDDIFLETFEQDMKYSDTPIAASISEALADIYQPLFNFVEEVREGGAETLENAFSVCRANFQDYWSQTLCNVMRALNNLRLNC